MNPLNPIHVLGFTLSAFLRPRLGQKHLKNYQLRKLRRLLDHAASSNPFYRSWFEQHGFVPSNVRRLEDLQKLPPMRKHQLRELRESISEADIARGHLIEHKTSGSTGIPVPLPASLAGSSTKNNASCLPFVQPRRTMVRSKSGRWIVIENLDVDLFE